MDFAALPLHPIREQPKFRLFSLCNYSGPESSIQDRHRRLQEWYQYPDRQGWGQKTYREWQKLFQDPSAEFQAFLQRWLCFAALEAALDRHIDVEKEFTRWEQGCDQPYLDIRRLVESSRHMTYENIGLVTAAASLAQNIAAYEFGPSVHLLSDQDPEEEHSLEHFIRLGQVPVTLDTPVAIGLTSISEFLMNAIGREALPNFSWTDFQKAGSALMLHITLAPKWESRMWALLRKDGWCPNQISFMFSNFDMCGLLFMFHIQRPDPCIRHDVIRVHESNLRTGRPQLLANQPLCTSFACGHKKLDKRTYETRHVSSGCKCHHVSASPEHLLEILRAEAVPLILCIDDDDDVDQITLAPGQNDCDYVAISHVWSDGLGNVRGNSIPLCQLRRLSKWVRELKGNDSSISLFWLDTICIPQFEGTQTDEQRKLRRMAISNMRHIYEKCTASLILDSWLLSTRGAGMSEAELLMRVFTCAWNTRLWTYQEGALPPAVYFQFQDAAFNLDEIAETFLSLPQDNIMLLTLGGQLHRQYNSLRAFRSVEMREQVPCIFNALRHRTTTINTDEPICLSTLLNLDTSELLKTAPTKRMEKLWRMIPQVPLEVLLYTGKRMDAPGLGWAPRSLLLWPGQEIAPGGTLHDQYLKQIDEGLVMEAEAIEFDCAQQEIGGIFWFKDENGVWYQVQAQFDVHAKTRLSTGGETVVIEPWATYKARRMAILLERGRKGLDHLSMGSFTFMDQPAPMIVIQERRTDMILGHKVGIGKIRKLDSRTSAETLAKLEEAYPEEKFGATAANSPEPNKITITWGNTTPKKKWCMT